jgi:hypothetical protein
VSEGVFDTTEAADKEIKQLVSERDFRLVMSAIRSLDTLGKRRFLRRHGLRRQLDAGAWRAAVERLLVDALAQGAPAAGQKPVATAV